MFVMDGNFCSENFYIDINFYNDEHKNLLGSYPYPKEQISKMKVMVLTPLKIDPVDFLTYYLFHNKKHNPVKFPNKLEVSKFINHAFDSISIFFGLQNGSLRGLPNVLSAENSVVEHIGDAIGMIVISELHELISADWEVIPITKEKDFDFSISSTGNYFVQIETKGSFVKNNKNKPSTINNHRKSIIDKKDYIRKSGRNHHFPINVMYGVIASIDSVATHNLQCWLLDPPPSDINYDPMTYKYLSRISFASKFINLISPDSQLTESIKNRVKEINIFSDYSSLNSSPLLKRNGSGFFIYDGKVPDFFYKKLIIENNNNKVGGGSWFHLNDSAVFFIGLTADFVKLIARHNVDEIIGFNQEIMKIEGEWKLYSEWTANDRAEYSKFLTKPIVSLTHEGQSVFKVNGAIGVSKSGIMMGVLDVAKN